MNKRIIIAIIASAGFALAFVTFQTAVRAQSVPVPVVASSTDPNDISAQIAAKQQQLNAVNAQLNATKAVLKTTQQQKQTLQTQITTINNGIKGLNLSIQARTLTSQQLALEVEQLNSNLTDIQSSISVKQGAIESVLKQLQRNDTTNGNLLLVFLKQNSLADGVFEAQNLTNLQGQLSNDISSLSDLHGQYADRLQLSTTKKAQIAVEQKNLQNQAAIMQDQQAEKQTLLTTTKGQESTYQKQVAALQLQQQQIASDIESLDAIQRSKINSASIPKPLAGILLVPIQGDDTSDITQQYGATSFALGKNGYTGHWHNGLDLAAPVGTPILAADSGVISGMANEDLYCYKGAYGKFITINHFNGLTTLYAHLSSQIVTIGQTVKRGDVIGYSGKTGYALGPHLHFTVYAQSTFSIKQSKTCGPLPVGGDLNPYGYLF